jgi:hypothetical protein
MTHEDSMTRDIHRTKGKKPRRPGFTNQNGLYAIMISADNVTLTSQRSETNFNDILRWIIRDSQ